MLSKAPLFLSAVAIWLLPILPAQQQASTTATEASAKEGAAIPSERGRILGIGGIFFKSANHQVMREWYGRHLKLADKGAGVMLPWREKDNADKEHVTVWTVFPQNTKYFEPLPTIVFAGDASESPITSRRLSVCNQRNNPAFGL